MRGQCLYTSAHSFLPQKHLCNEVRFFFTCCFSLPIANGKISGLILGKVHVLYILYRLQ